MRVIVDTYNHPRKWRQHKIFPSIKNAIHICATRNTADGIADQYNEFDFIYTIHEVFQGVFYKWHSPEYKLEQYLTLAKIIRDIDEVENLKQSFIYNLSELQDTIRTLIICNVDYKDFSNEYILTNRELFFKKIFKRYLELNDELVLDTKWRLSKGSKPSNCINKILNKINLNKHKLSRQDNPEIKIEKPKTVLENCTTIVLHGFYFITPEQQVFLKFLQRSGYKIHFFQFYDERFPKTFNFSKKFISSKFDWTDNWNIEKSSNDEKGSLGKVFLNAFEGNLIPKTHKKINVLEYDSFFKFLEEVIIKNYPINDHADSNNVSIIATSADMLNEVLIQYYPERYPNRYNFLNYPIGQFLLKLHEMHTCNC